MQTRKLGWYVPVSKENFEKLKNMCAKSALLFHPEVKQEAQPTCLAERRSVK